MSKLIAKIMVFLACSVVILHAMVPHHHMSCGIEGSYIAAPHTHYGMCDSDDDCFELKCMAGVDSDKEHRVLHHQHETGEYPISHCKLQDLLTKSLLNHNEYDIYTAIICDAVLDLFFDELSQEILVALLPMATCEWGEYVAILPTQGVLSDAPLRAPPIC